VFLVTAMQAYSALHAAVKSVRKANFRQNNLLQNSGGRRPVARISQEGAKTTRGAIVLNTIWDVCSNRGAKHEMGWQHCPPAGNSLSGRLKCKH